MFFSRAVLVVFKNTGGKRWHGRDGLQPLSGSQKRNRNQNVEQTLKNLSVLKMAAAHEPPVPTRLYKPLNFWRQMWMKRKLESAKTVLGWDTQAGKLLPAGKGSSQRALPMSLAARAAAPVSVSFETRVQALADQLHARNQQQTGAPKHLTS